MYKYGYLHIEKHLKEGSPKKSASNTENSTKGLKVELLWLSKYF